MSVDAGSLREEIFRLRAQDPPVSIRKIAALLGVSAGRVQRELDARAAGQVAGENGANGSNGEGPLPRGNQIQILDPDLRDRRQAVERRRLALQEAELEARELETRNRLEVLKRAGGGGPGGDPTFASLVIEELRDLRHRIDARPQTSQSQSVVQALTEFSELGRVVRDFTPARAPTSALDLEFEIANQRVKEESQRILRKAELEAAIAKTKAEGEAARNHAMAKVIEDVGPALITAAAKWFEAQSKTSEPAGTAPAAGGTAAPTLGGGTASSDAPGSAAVKGYCPRCGAGEMEIVPTGTDADHCPACGLILAVENGTIVSGERSLPALEVARYAS